MIFYSEFDYSILNSISSERKRGKNNGDRFSKAIIMLDTETSKSTKNREYIKNGKKQFDIVDNYIVAWSIAIRYEHNNICTLYGRTPYELVQAVQRIKDNLLCNKVYIFIHNLSYDWVFIRKFFIAQYGNPIKQLNTKPHYPITIEFNNGIILRDSLILAQRALERWCNDLNVEHKKAVGFWNYDIIRHQNTPLTNEELLYIENDVLGGVECIDQYLISENKRLVELPLTATGIVRNEIYKRSHNFSAHQHFLSMALTAEQQQMMEQVFHGGFSHANRYLVDYTITDNVQCFDFASSYPFILLSERFPMEKFTQLNDISDIYKVLDKKDNYAFMFKFIATNVKLKDYKNPMPVMQFSKCIKTVNALCDNGRILLADYVEIRITEIDLELFTRYYKWDFVILKEVYFAYKSYLPRWLTDYVYSLFIDKTKLKEGDKVLYAIAKGKINSVYGVHVQKPVKDDIIEDYATGEHNTNVKNNDSYIEAYNTYIKKYRSVLPFQWGVWVTAYALYNLFTLGECAGTWLYSDTDSCYGINWDMKKVNDYNEQCKTKLRKNNYDAVLHNGKEYWLGVASSDGLNDIYKEFRIMGAKRYCGRCSADNELHITVAGVPKNGVICLNNNIDNFTKGFLFSGDITNKKTHRFVFTEEIKTNSYGDVIGDYIDLTPCDYLLDGIEVYYTFDDLMKDNIEVVYYE